MTESSDKVDTYSIGFTSPGDETHDAAEKARFLGTTITKFMRSAGF